MAVSIGISCFALMLVIFMQYKVVKQTDLTSIENMRESELQSELADWRKKYEEITERYDEVKEKIAEYQQEKESDEATAELLQKELEQLTLALGTTDISGEGIIITVTDNNGQRSADDEEIEKISESDILQIIKELFKAGAEAISINDNRIVAMTDVFALGSSSYLQVDSQRISSPYVIKAIGNKAYLESAVYNKDGILNDLKNSGHSVELQNSNKTVLINKFTGSIDSKYMTDKN